MEDVDMVFVSTDDRLKDERAEAAVTVLCIARLFDWPIRSLKYGTRAHAHLAHPQWLAKTGVAHSMGVYIISKLYNQIVCHIKLFKKYTFPRLNGLIYWIHCKMLFQTVVSYMLVYVLVTI